MAQMQTQDVELASAQFIEEHRWPANSNGVELSERHSAEWLFVRP